MTGAWEEIHEQLVSRVRDYGMFVIHTCDETAASEQCRSHRPSRPDSVDYLKKFVLQEHGGHCDRDLRAELSERHCSYEERVRAVLENPHDLGEEVREEIVEIAIFVASALVPSLVFCRRRTAAVELADFAVRRFFEIAEEFHFDFERGRYDFFLYFMSGWTLAIASMEMDENEKRSGIAAK